MSYQYKNISDSTQTLTGSKKMSKRVVEPGETVICESALENPNFEFVGESDDAVDGNQVVGKTGQQPNAVTEATLETDEQETPNGA